MSSLYRFTFRVPFTARALSLLPASAHQRGLWIDRQSASCTVVGLGRVLLYVERQRGPLLRRYV